MTRFFMAKLRKGTQLVERAGEVFGAGKVPEEFVDEDVQEVSLDVHRFVFPRCRGTIGLYHAPHVQVRVFSMTREPATSIPFLGST